MRTPSDKGSSGTRASHHAVHRPIGNCLALDMTQQLPRWLSPTARNGHPLLATATPPLTGSFFMKARRKHEHR